MAAPWSVWKAEEYTGLYCTVLYCSCVLCRLCNNKTTTNSSEKSRSFIPILFLVLLALLLLILHNLTPISSKKHSNVPKMETYRIRLECIDDPWPLHRNSTLSKLERHLLPWYRRWRRTPPNRKAERLSFLIPEKYRSYFKTPAILVSEDKNNQKGKSANPLTKDSFFLTNGTRPQVKKRQISRHLLSRKGRKAEINFERRPKNRETNKKIRVYTFSLLFDNDVDLSTSTGAWRRGFLVNSTRVNARLVKIPWHDRDDAIGADVWCRVGFARTVKVMVV